jgi:hypothetical protein
MSYKVLALLDTETGSRSVDRVESHLVMNTQCSSGPGRPRSAVEILLRSLEHNAAARGGDNRSIDRS